MDTNLKPKISIRDTSFSHGVGLGSGDFNWPPDYFDYDRSKEWQKICLFTDGEILNNEVIHSKSQINIAWILEPYSICPHTYHFISIKDVYSKYDFILTHCKELIKVNPDKFKYYPFGGCWIQPENRKIHNKSKLISIIASSKNITYGHKLRHKVIEKIKSLDVFGNGYNYITQKELALKDYMFSIIIENDKNDGYFTEKLIDCLITGTIPIYWGSDISDKFDMDGIIQFSNIDQLEEIIPSLNTPKYRDMHKSIGINFRLAHEYIKPENWIYNQIIKYL